MPRRCVCNKVKPNSCLDIWQNAETVIFVRNDNGGPLPEVFATRAKLLWDDRNLYIRIECSDPYIWATKTGSKEPLWEEEVIEIFIDPDRDGKNYIELEVNPLNNILTLLIPAAEEKGRWKENARFELKGFKTEVVCLDKGWVVNASIPFENFKPWTNVPPKDGDVWGFNLYRIERPIKDSPQEWVLMAFSPTFKDDFHIPELFGEIVFNKR